MYVLNLVRMSEKLDCTPLLGGSTTCVLAGAEVEGVTLHWMAECSASTHFRHRAQVTNSCSVVVSCARLLNPRHCDCHMNLSTIWTVLITDCNNPSLTKCCPCSWSSRPSLPWSSENNYEKEFGPTKRSMYYKLTNIRIGLLCIFLLIIWSLLYYYYTCFMAHNK